MLVGRPSFLDVNDSDVVVNAGEQNKRISRPIGIVRVYLKCLKQLGLLRVDASNQFERYIGRNFPG